MVQLFLRLPRLYSGVQPMSQSEAHQSKEVATYVECGRPEMRRSRKLTTQMEYAVLRTPGADPAESLFGTERPGPWYERHTLVYLKLCAVSYTGCGREYYSDVMFLQAQFSSTRC